jgi:hypothetical protein
MLKMIFISFMMLISGIKSYGQPEKEEENMQLDSIE